MNAFLAELRRRKVIRVAAAYLVAAWAIMQGVNVATPALELPGWFDGGVFVLLTAGFVIAVALAWVFELTPEGIKRTAPTAEGATAAPLARTDLALVAALVAVLGVSLFQAIRPAPAPGAGTVATASPFNLSIAVLPFADMSPDGDQEYFSDGLSEELLNVLAQIGELRVAGRTSSFAFKGRNEDLRAIGEQLGVANILEGSVRKSGDRLRITAQLVSAADGYHLWSETYDRQLDDVFAVQEEIAMAVASALSVTLGVDDAPPSTPQTGDVAVYDLYLRGLALVRNPGSSDAFLRAADIFRGVIALDPDFMRARVALAGTYVPILSLFPERTDEHVAQLESVAADALARAPDDPGSHYVSGILHLQRQQWLEAEAAFARTGSEQVGVVSVVPYPAILLFYVGRASEAAEWLAAASVNDPLALDVSNFLQMALTAAGRYEEAEAEYRRSTALDRTAAPIEHVALIRAWGGGDDALVRARFDRYLEVQSVAAPLNAAVRAVYDDPAAALALVRAAADQPDMQDSTRQMFVGLYAGHYGDSDLAVAAMRRSVLDMRGPLVQTLWFPELAEARRTESFKVLVRDLGLVAYWRATGNWGDFCRPVGEDDFECE
jgi:TolB-like protein